MTTNGTFYYILDIYCRSAGQYNSTGQGKGLLTETDRILPWFNSCTTILILNGLANIYYVWIDYIDIILISYSTNVPLTLHCFVKNLI